MSESRDISVPHRSNPDGSSDTFRDGAWHQLTPPGTFVELLNRARHASVAAALRGDLRAQRQLVEPIEWALDNGRWQEVATYAYQQIEALRLRREITDVQAADARLYIESLHG